MYVNVYLKDHLFLKPHNVACSQPECSDCLKMAQVVLHAFWNTLLEICLVANLSPLRV